MNNDIERFDPLPWMEIAMEEASAAAAKGEVPVGAVIVKDRQILSTAHNLIELKNSASAHAEILAIESAGKKNGNWRLDGAKLIVTLEPCPMCISAAVLARISEIYFSLADPRLGACGSIFDLTQHPALPHKIKVFSGTLAESYKVILDNFFKNLRR